MTAPVPERLHWLIARDVQAYVDLVNDGVRAMIRHKDTASTVEAIIEIAEPVIRADERCRVLADLREQVQALDESSDPMYRMAIDSVLALLDGGRAVTTSVPESAGLAILRSHLHSETAGGVSAMTTDVPDDTPQPDDLNYEAWALLANAAYWDHTDKRRGAEWDAALIRWRDRWHATLSTGGES